MPSVLATILLTAIATASTALAAVIVVPNQISALDYAGSCKAARVHPIILDSSSVVLAAEALKQANIKMAWIGGIIDSSEKIQQGPYYVLEITGSGEPAPSLLDTRKDRDTMTLPFLAQGPIANPSHERKSVKKAESKKSAKKNNGAEKPDDSSSNHHPEKVLKLGKPRGRGKKGPQEEKIIYDGKKMVKSSKKPADAESETTATNHGDSQSSSVHPGTSEKKKKRDFREERVLYDHKGRKVDTSSSDSYQKFEEKVISVSSESDVSTTSS